jgi:hypothetical protein
VTWVHEVRDALLLAAKFQGSDATQVEDLLEGTIGRVVPRSNRWIVQEGEGSSTLLVLHEGALYRLVLRVNADPTVEVERIDLERRVAKVALMEQVEGSGRLKSRWHFEFEGGGSLDIADAEKFGRALADVAGWAS